ncbi:uncharacterized protein LOC142973103 [Anticarsia gemmatalis]|uniref:uncharacterized protein LOC142973103 n=1 Tax=Anticarsia gemmatalis TaxID=129554 RepID=UPI003F77126C
MTSQIVCLVIMTLVAVSYGYSHIYPYASQPIAQQVDPDQLMYFPKHDYSVSQRGPHNLGHGKHKIRFYKVLPRNDVGTQQEEREGDAFRGFYDLNQPDDGVIRRVKYPVNGPRPIPLQFLQGRMFK